MPTLFIGMPVFNGERFLERALDSLINQTFSDWILLISDNCSTDDTPRICKLACERDNRIFYIKQTENIGALNNFKFLLEKANTQYFMWAAADDEWGPQFLDACINGLENAPDAGLAFCNIVNIDSFGQVIREYPSFKMFVHNDLFASVASYLLAPEFLGKANLFYGVYRLASLKGYLLQFISSNYVPNPGFDMSLILGVLCRSYILIDDRVLFKKRLERHTDQLGKPDLIPTELPYVSVWSKMEQDLYFNDMRMFSADTPYAELIESLLHYRANLNQDLLDFQKTAIPFEKDQMLQKIRYKTTTFIGKLWRYLQRLHGVFAEKH